MVINQLDKFFFNAKINTYASSGERREKILPDGSKEFEFKEGEFRDILVFPFIGKEVVWYKERAIWGMNYYGKIISGIIPPKQIYQFLQEVLRKIPKDKPFRGPRKFKKDNFQYLNKVKGKIEKFEGEEKIFYKDKLVYRLIYHGGIVIEK